MTTTATPQVLTPRVARDGTQSAQAVSTPTADQSGCRLDLLPNRTIPIIFLPGIMGSNLRLTKERTAEVKKLMDKDNDISWRPEAKMETLALVAKTPAQRQLIMDPNETMVDRYDLSAKEADARHNNVSDVPYIHASNLACMSKQQRDQYARLRGWSEVFFKSYGTLLQTLESQLNQMCEGGQPRPTWTAGPQHTVDVAPKEWGGNTGSPLSATELQTLSDAWYPVHAIGYNWLRSNGESAKDVAQRIREIINYYKGLQFDCDKVIVVTHSMGGLVGRALLHPEYGNAQDVIAGVVHGAMPAVGAAAAYKRIRMGFEGGGVDGFIFKEVVGDTGPKVTAVLCNSPGGLQLLPSERYGSGWLRVTMNGKDLMEPLPKSDPYEEIYTVQDKWYRLINPEWVNPAGQLGSSIDKTMMAVMDARKFHQAISETYHKPNTYLSYGFDNKQKSWGEVVWEAGKAPLLRGWTFKSLPTDQATPVDSWQSSYDEGTGTVVLNHGFTSQPDRFFGAEIADPAQPGDGTVPAERSAEDPVRQGKARIIFKQTGYEHQGSYENEKVLASTLHSICRIALEAFTWKTQT